MRIALLLLSFCLIAPFATAQDDMDMAAMAQFSQPDENHEFLHAFAGEWTYHSTAWMMPGAPPMESDGVASISMDLGGRYLIGVHTGNMMGMPFEGRGTTGYDKASGKYLVSWIDNMGTGIMLFEGQIEYGRLVVETDYSNPMSGTMEQHKMVQWVEGNTYTMEYYLTPVGGEEMLAMRIVSTRAGE